MKLLHYFVTEKDYSPVVIKGANNEIWLEKLDGDYKIIRLTANYIHNNEQLDVDLYRSQAIMKRIRQKTMSLNINALNIFVNLGEAVNFDEVASSGISCVNIKDMHDLNTNDFIISVFPDIAKKTDFHEKGMALFLKLTGDISKTNDMNAKKAEDVFAKKKPIVTRTLIIINLLVFILAFVIGRNNIIEYASNYGPYIKNGELYRLISAAFVHLDVIHLLCNMYALYVIGPQIESFFGKRKFLIIYFGSAIIGNLLSIIFNMKTASIGASGAIFGLLGALLYFGYHYRIYLESVLKSQIIPLIILNLAIGFMASGIDNAAHIGGLIGGILLAKAVGVKHKSTNASIINGIAMTLIFIGFLGYMLFMK